MQCRQWDIRRLARGAPVAAVKPVATGAPQKAEIVVLDKGPFAIPADQIHPTEATIAMTDGRVTDDAVRATGTAEDQRFFSLDGIQTRIRGC